MSNWKSININSNMIKAETERSVLIAMPHSSQYDGFTFWHPAKLVREGRHSAALSVSYTPEFTFTLKKYGKGKTNYRDVVAERQIGVEDFEEAFGVVDQNITAHEDKNPYETHKPEHLEAQEVEALEELKDE